MNKKLVFVIFMVVLMLAVVVFSYNLGSSGNSNDVTKINLGYDLNGTKMNFDNESQYFGKYAYREDYHDGSFDFVWYTLKKDMEPLYSELAPSANTIVIAPIFTSSAYWSPGFYDFYEGKCAECFTTPIRYTLPLTFHSSLGGLQILSLLGYDYITDIEVDKNPEILKKYDKVILLHNEYVTKKNSMQSHLIQK